MLKYKLCAINGVELVPVAEISSSCSRYFGFTIFSSTNVSFDFFCCWVFTRSYSFELGVGGCLRAVLLQKMCSWECLFDLFQTSVGVCLCKLINSRLPLRAGQLR